MGAQTVSGDLGRTGAVVPAEYLRVLDDLREQADTLVVVTVPTVAASVD